MSIACWCHFKILWSSLSLSYFGSFVIFSFHIRFKNITCTKCFHIFFLLLYCKRASSQKREANKNSFVNTPTFYLYTYRSPSLFFELMKDAIVRGIITFSAYNIILIIFLKKPWHPLPTQTFYWGLRLFVSRSKKNVFNSDFTTNKVDGGSRENNNIAIYRFYSEMNFIQDRKMYV